MSEESPRGGYKVLLVPADQITALSDGLPQMATVAAESSVCNCDDFKAGPFEVVGDVGPDRQMTMTRAMLEQIEIIG